MAKCEAVLLIAKSGAPTEHPCHRHLGHNSLHQTHVGKNLEGWADHKCTPGTYPTCTFCYPKEEA